MPTTGRSDIVDIAGTLLIETDKAYKIDFGEFTPTWLPKSQVENNGDGTWAMPEWLATEKGLI